MSKEVDNDIDSIIPDYALAFATNPELQQSVQAARVRKRGREVKDSEDVPTDTVRTARSDSSTEHRADGPGVPIHSKPANSKQRSRTKQVSVDGNDEFAPESSFAQVVCVAQGQAKDSKALLKAENNGLLKNINRGQKGSIKQYMSKDGHTVARTSISTLRGFGDNSTSCSTASKDHYSVIGSVSALSVSPSPASPTSPEPKVSRQFTADSNDYSTAPSSPQAIEEDVNDVSGDSKITMEDDNDCEDCDDNDPILSTASINESKKCETDENLEQEDPCDYKAVTTDDIVGSIITSPSAVSEKNDLQDSTTPARPNIRSTRNVNANRDQVTSTSSYLKSEVNKCAPIKLTPICSEEDQTSASKINDKALKHIYYHVFDENNDVELYPPDLMRPSEFDQVYLNVSRPYSTDELPKPSPIVPLDTVLKFGYVRYVGLPWSTSNVGPGGLRYHYQRKKALDFILGKNELEVTDLEAVMSVCRNEVTHFKALYRYYFSLSEDERPNIPKLIQKIANLARRAEEIITKPLEYLLSPKPDEKSQIHTATLSQEQCACLIANAFFCFYPEDDKKRDLNLFNMCDLFSNGGSVVKWKFIFHYFQCVTDKMPTGCVTFGRKTMHAEDIPQWDLMDQPIVTIMAVSDEEPIENRHKFLQMDFANKYIGGGVLGSGAVQEEIRFLICPEMLVSMLLCPRMKTNEAIYITGAQRYSSYKGYGNTLEWCPYNEYGHDERDKFGRVINELVAIDAKYFGTDWKREQYQKRFIDRELKKAYIGFHSFKKTTSRNDLSPVATGNWGCGVFGGDRKLKSLLQLIAADAAHRNMVYVPFQQGKDDAFAKELNYMYWKIRKQKVPISKLYKLMCAYDSRKSRCLFRYLLVRLRDDDGEATKTDDMEVISAASDA